VRLGQPGQILLGPMKHYCQHPLCLSAEGPVNERLADIDSETGPQGEGAMGGEPDVALVLIALAQAAEGARSSASLFASSVAACCHVGGSDTGAQTGMPPAPPMWRCLASLRALRPPRTDICAAHRCLEVLRLLQRRDCLPRPGLHPAATPCCRVAGRQRAGRGGPNCVRPAPPAGRQPQCQQQRQQRRQ